MIHIIREKATKEEIAEMLEVLGSYVKVAVDVAALINLRPRQNNRSMEVKDKKICTKMRGIINKRLGNK